MIVLRALLLVSIIAIYLFTYLAASSYESAGLQLL